MTTLRQKLIDEMEVRGLSRNTQESYLGFVSRLARHYRRPPDQISDEELRAHLLHLLRERKNGAATLCIAVSALRFFYCHVLQRSTDVIESALPRMKKPVVRPRVFSPEQVAQLLQVDGLNLKHRTMLMTTYAAGLRVSELCFLRTEHILSERGQIRIEQGKGRKDRYTVLSPRLLEQLRAYWRVYRPAAGWLFTSTFWPDRPLTTHSAMRVFNRAVKLANGARDAPRIHDLRHTFASRHIAGWNRATAPIAHRLLLLSRYLGHRRLNDTWWYVSANPATLRCAASRFEHFVSER